MGRVEYSPEPQQRDQQWQKYWPEIAASLEWVQPHHLGQDWLRYCLLMHCQKPNIPHPLQKRMLIWLLHSTSTSPWTSCLIPVEPELPAKKQNNEANQYQVKSPFQLHDHGDIDSSSRKSYNYNQEQRCRFTSAEPHRDLTWISGMIPYLDLWNDSNPKI